VTTYPPGAWLFREGSTAKEFHLVVSGTVAVSMHVPGRGDHVVDTVDACETVGWSWLVPPYRWFFDARATTEVTAVTIDAVALRTIAEQEPAFGYALLRQVTVVMLERMQAARVRLADLYGPAA
jgi:CRP-like cAMP-binding protein